MFTNKLLLCFLLIRKSASCTHVSALPDALASLAPSGSNQTQNNSSDEEATIPVTSYLCKWNEPRKRKESNKTISESVFNKHVYGRQRKHQLKPFQDFDPRPVDLRETANENLKDFLKKVRGQGLGVSLLKDEQSRCWSSSLGHSLLQFYQQNLSCKSELKNLKKSLVMPSLKLREIEQSTRDQSDSPLWHSVRQYRITASYFGAVYCRGPSTPPQSLVLQIMNKSTFTSHATDWGKRKEVVALEKYREVQNEFDPNRLYYSKSGFVVNENYPFLGVSPDAVVHDTQKKNPSGLAEVKCPYSFRNQTPFEAAQSTSFCCELVDQDNTTILKLKHSHPYYCQVQGQMAITERT